MPPTLSTVLEETEKVRAGWAADPVAFFRDVLEVTHVDPPCQIDGCTSCVPYSRVMAESVRDHRRTIVSACHDSAKTFTAGAIFWWWMLSFPPATIVTSSSTGRQVQRGLWKEIRAHYWRSKFLQANFPEPLLESWSYSETEPDWYGFGFSTRPDQSESGATRVQSQHSPNLLMIFDEATAVDRSIWDAAKGSLTQEHNHWLVLANPTDPTSEFANVWRTGAGWNRIEINALDTPNLRHGDGTNPYLVTHRWVDEYILDNGVEHPLVQARVYGRLPSESTITLISYGDLLGAYEREPAPRPVEGFERPSIGVDVARFGDDLTAIAVIRGDDLIHLEHYAGKDTVFTAGQVREIATAYGLTEAHASRIAIDDTGLGGGVTDILRANGWRVNAEDFGRLARDVERFYDRRTELWVSLRDWLRREAALSRATVERRRWLEADLPGVIYEMRAKGAKTVMKLEAKKDMKKRLGHSPDHGDALALALAYRTASRGLDRSSLTRQLPAEATSPRINQRPAADVEEARRRRKNRRAGIYDRDGSVGAFYD